MSLPTHIQQTYTAILREELVPAMGCTEPIAIAYAASILRHALGADPTALRVELSGNIIKNVKSVIVPPPTACMASRPPWPRASWQAVPTASWRCCAP